MNSTSPRPAALTYAESGVDTAAGDRAVELMKEAVAAIGPSCGAPEAGSSCGAPDIDVALSFGCCG